ncbi:MAG: helix-turn-helix transcriptional regulator [Synechococcaceae cyanobacterium]|nr:helix-turn-helix transcriptional regulator [Synechococcaceae cyanobacterium]
MSSTEAPTTRHHPSWREIRDNFLADPQVRQSYQELAPRFDVIRQLIALREQRGWSQRELADRAGMKQPQLARLETGQVEPKLDTLQRLANAMGCKVQVSFEPQDHNSTVNA